jgi:hypothetical protein
MLVSRHRILAAAVALSIAAVSLACLATESRSNQMSNCSEIQTLRDALLRPVASDSSANKYSYAVSMTHDIDEYKTAWILLMQGKTRTKPKMTHVDFARGLLKHSDSRNASDVLFWQRLGLLILDSYGELPPWLDTPDEYASYAESATNSEFDKNARREIALTEVLVFEDSSSASRKYIATLPSERSTFPNIESIEEAALSVRISDSNANSASALEELAGSILKSGPSGAGVYALFILKTVLGSKLTIPQDAISTYLEGLKAPSGGLGFTPGQMGEPQVTYYGLILSPETASNRELPFGHMRSGDLWVREAGRMPLGTMLFLDAIMSRCRLDGFTDNHVEVDKQERSVHSCLRKKYEWVSSSEWRHYLESNELGKHRESLLASLCGIKYASHNELKALRSGEPGDLTIRDALSAYLQVAAAGHHKLAFANFRSLKSKHGCRSSLDSTASDLYATAICSAIGLFTELESKESLKTFTSKRGISMFVGQPDNQLNSVEALLLKFAVMNANEGFAAELALL